MALSSSGQYQTALFTDGGSIYTSSNYGSTWTQNTNAPTNAYWRSVSLSGSGQYQLASTGYTDVGSIYFSSNYGSTWSTSSYAPTTSSYWGLVLMSKSAQYFFASSTGWYACQNSISSGIVNVGNYSSTPARGITGGLYYDPTNGFTGLFVSNGSSWKSVKSFVIDHPDNSSKYLVHGCLEGPESGVYYRGVGEIKNNESVTINLPDYVKNLARDFTVEITPIYDGNRKKTVYLSSEIVNNKFTVYGPNGEFYWHAYGKRLSLNVEPYKKEILVKGDGPYRWIQ